MIYSESERLVYYPVPKVACGSFKRALLLADGIDEPNEWRVHSHKRWYRPSPPGSDTWDSFTFVRHPLSRLASAYREKLQKGNAKSFGCPLPRTASMDEWVNWVTSKQSHKVDGHWKPQHLILSDRNPSFLGRFESIIKDWESLRNRSHLNPTKLPALPWHNRCGGDVEERFSDKSFNRLCKFYGKDFTLYGYSPEEYRTYKALSASRIEKDQRSNPHKVGGWIHSVEYDALVELATDRRVLEIGTWQGLSTGALAQRAKHVTTIDWFKGDRYTARYSQTKPETLVNRLYAGLRNNGVEDQVTLIVADFRNILPLLNPLDFDLLFYDGDHGGEPTQVAMDWALGMSAQSTVCVHDYKPNNPIMDGLRAAVDTFTSRANRPLRRIGSIAIMETQNDFVASR